MFKAKKEYKVTVTVEEVPQDPDLEQEILTCISIANMSYNGPHMVQRKDMVFIYKTEGTKIAVLNSKSRSGWVYELPRELDKTKILNGINGRFLKKLAEQDIIGLEDGGHSWNLYVPKWREYLESRGIRQVRQKQFSKAKEAQ